MKTVRLCAIGLAVVLSSSGCGGPTVPLGLFVREEKADLTLGNPNDRQPPPETRPPGAEPFNPGFPSFVTPPPPPSRLEADSPLPPQGVDRDDPEIEGPPGPGPLGDCPAPAPGENPALIATSDIAAPPQAGDYTFRRTGTARVGSRTVDLAGTVTRRIANIKTTTTAGRTTWRYDSAQRETGAVAGRKGVLDALTTTTYEIDPNAGVEVANQPGGDSAETTGFKIVAVRTESAAGTDSFSPQPPVRVLMLPVTAKGYDEHGGGTDPLVGTRMETIFRTVERVEVEGCGVRYQAWRQVVRGTYFDASGAPGATGSAHRLYFASELFIATQYGGLILGDRLALSDRPPVDAGALVWTLPAGTDVDVRSATIITRVPGA